jgi:metal-sulfur cluster biosynthetic enzyme
MNGLEERVQAALEDVIDPCSITAGSPLSVVDMGMITGLTADDKGRVSIGMRATSAMCTMIAGIMKVAEDRISQVEGVTSVDVTLQSGPMWTEADMTARGRSTLNARRAASRASRPVKPHEWKTRVAVEGRLDATP